MASAAGLLAIVATAARNAGLEAEPVGPRLPGRHDVLYDHDTIMPFGERLFAAPISTLWGRLVGIKLWPFQFTSPNRMETDGTMDAPFNAATLTITPPLLALISERDEFKGAWRARKEKLRTLCSERS